MVSRRFCWLPVIAALSSSVLADTANCTVEIENVTAEVQSKTAAKEIVEFAFEFSPGGAAQRKYFNLPGGRYLCTLAFFNLDSGTSLSCEKKADLGDTYVQSDRTNIEEHSAKNNLVFRNGADHFVLNATCR